MSCKKHKCECKHQSVRYCSKCMVVHCDDCNQEWTAKVSNPYITYTYPSTWGHSGTYTLIGSNQSNGTDVTWETKCEHKA